MSDLSLRFDPTLPLASDPGTGHNRWHPAIPPLLHVEPGQTIVLDVRDGMDGQVPPGADGPTLALDLGRGHPLSGPISVVGASPGDLVEVELLGIEPAEVGFTVVLPDHCLLAHRALEQYVVHWSLEDGVARSPQLPGVAIPAAPFLGCIGVAPSLERVRAVVERERALGLELPAPMAAGAVPAVEPVASEGLHTVPPREFGGNADVPQWGVGTRVLLPVEVPGALLSVGDPHFAQGDGEVAGSALEMRARVRLRVGLRTGEARRLGLRAPAFEGGAGAPGPASAVGPASATGPTSAAGSASAAGPTSAVGPASAAGTASATGSASAAGAPRPVFATTGVSVDTDGRQRHLDVRAAAINAVDQLVDWLVATRGWRAEQALALASVAADLRIGSIVNTPNAVVSAQLPLDVFED